MSKKLVEDGRQFVALTSDDLQVALEKQMIEMRFALTEMKDSICDSMKDMFQSRSLRPHPTLPSGAFGNSPRSNGTPVAPTRPKCLSFSASPSFSANPNIPTSEYTALTRVLRLQRKATGSINCVAFKDEVDREDPRNIAAASSPFHNFSSDDDEVPPERCDELESPRDKDGASDGSPRVWASQKASNTIPLHVSRREPRRSTYVTFRQTAVTYSHNYEEAETVRGFVESFCSSFVELVTRESGDCISATMILLNAMWIGYEVDYILPYQDSNKALPLIYLMVDGAFCMGFVLELLCRMIGYGRTFFTDENNWNWHILDCVLVITQLLDIAFQLCGQIVNYYLGAWLRLMRLIRVVRMVRLVRFVRELRMITSSIVGSIKCLMWTMFLLLLLMYMVALCLREMFEDNREVVAAGDSLPVYCGSLGRIILALFASITGGINWGDLVYPFYKGGFPVMGGILCFYIAFCIFALMNVVTSVFVERALITAERDNNTVLVDNLWSLFDMKGAITLDAFEEKLDTAAMKEYFEAVNLDTSEAPYLFEILDMDGSGSVDREEFVSGLLRLRGHAKALDLTVLMKETSRVYQHMEHQMHQMSHHLERLIIGAEGNFPSPRSSIDLSRSVICESARAESSRAVAAVKSSSSSWISPDEAAAHRYPITSSGVAYQ